MRAPVTIPAGTAVFVPKVSNADSTDDLFANGSLSMMISKRLAYIDFVLLVLYTQTTL